MGDAESDVLSNDVGFNYETLDGIEEIGEFEGFIACWNIASHTTQVSIPSYSGQIQLYGASVFDRFDSAMKLTNSKNLFLKESPRDLKVENEFEFLVNNFIGFISLTSINTAARKILLENIWSCISSISMNVESEVWISKSLNYKSTRKKLYYEPQLCILLDWMKHYRQAQQVFGTLFVLSVLPRTPVYRIVEETFPHLLDIFNGLVQIYSSLEVVELIKLICKIFWSLIYLEFPQQLFDPNVFNTWMILFLILLESCVTLEGQHDDPELREAWGWWNEGKWTVGILNRLFTQIGDLKTKKPENKAFAQMFQKGFTGTIVEGHLILLNTNRISGYLPNKIINLTLQYLCNIIPMNSMYSQLQSRLDVLLLGNILPLLCFNDNDQKLWDEEHHEYVRKGYDIIEDLYSPRTASVDVVREWVRKHGKEHLHKFILFIVDNFKRYDEAYRQRDGALLAIGALCDKLKQSEAYKLELEQLLVQRVFTEFNSPTDGFRAKAAWVAEQYDYINFFAVSRMRDAELPAHVYSVFALRSFMEAHEALNEICPILPQLLDKFFKLVNEVVDEDPMFILETVSNVLSNAFIRIRRTENIIFIFDPGGRYILLQVDINLEDKVVLKGEDCHGRGLWERLQSWASKGEHSKAGKPRSTSPNEKLLTCRKRLPIRATEVL